jgi:HEAT repeat protein
MEIAQKDIGLRGLAIEALIAIGADVDAELLTGLLADPSVYLRRRLILLIIQQNYRRALPQLRPLLRDANISIRGAAIQAVTQMQDHESLGQIRWMAAQDSNPFIRIQAVEAVAKLMGREAASHLLALTNDSNFQVRRAAIRHLLEWEIQDTAVLTSLARFAQSFPEEELTAQIYKALQQYGFDLAYAEQAPHRTDNLLVPDELLSKIPNLIMQLEGWQKSLRQAETLMQDPEAERTDKALTYLIDILKRQGHSSEPDQ